MSESLGVPPVALCDGLFAYAVARDVGVNVFSSVTWTDELAARFMKECIAATRSHTRAGGRGGLSYFLGAPPGPSQRRIIVDALQREGISAGERTVIVSGSALVRGAATALGWLTRADTRTFTPKELSEAARYAAFDDDALAAQLLRYLEQCLKIVEATPSAR